MRNLLSKNNPPPLRGAPFTQRGLSFSSNRSPRLRMGSRFNLKPSPAEKVPRTEADEEIILRLNARFGQRSYRIFIGMMLSSSPASGPPSPLEKALKAFATATDGTNI